METAKKKYKYVHPLLIKATANILKAYKEAHKEAETPLISYCKEHNVGKADRVRFVRAAQQLGWAVIRSNGCVYDNGHLAWSE